MDTICQKTNINLHRCRQAVGSTWGFSPKTMYWMFTAIIRPILSYGAIIYITTLKKKYIIAKLNRIQRTSLLCVTSARHSTSSESLNAVMNIDPIKEYLIASALKSYHKIIHTIHSQSIQTDLNRILNWADT